MPDQYGNPTEAERRAQTVQPTLAMASPQEIAAFEASRPEIAANAVTDPRKRSDGGLANGSLPLSYFMSVYPNATKAQIDAYKKLNKAYRQGTSGTGGVGQSLASAGKFELDHVGNILEGLTDPTRILGIDPITTKIGNAVFGTDNEPLVNQMGGATSKEIRDYELKHGKNSSGAAQGLHNAAAGTAAVIAAGTLANGGLTGGQGGSSLTTMTPAEQAQITSQLTNVPGGVAAGAENAAGGVVGFGGAGTGGLPADLAADFAAAGQEAGALGNGLVLSGGAGTIGGSWLPSALKYADDVKGVYDLASAATAKPTSGKPASAPSGGSGNYASNPYILPQLSPRMRARLASRPHDMGARVAIRNAQMGVG